MTSRITLVAMAGTKVVANIMCIPANLNDFAAERPTVHVSLYCATINVQVIAITTNVY
jgi:hypothetical protein